MKQIFLDKGKMVVVKVFRSKQDLERELCGAKSLARFTTVPKIEKLDCKVAKIEFLNGFLGYQIPEEDLNLIIANYLQKLQSVALAQKYSVIDELDDLIMLFKDKPKLSRQAQKIKNQVQNLDFFPVHGDLQKQNIVINGGQLGLIDFEHFIFAPRELELANSLFFDDGNCLNIEQIIRLVPRNFINVELLKLMLNFYALKQIRQGMSEIEARERSILGFKRIDSSLLPKNRQTANPGSFKGMCYL